MTTEPPFADVPCQAKKPVDSRPLDNGRLKDGVDFRKILDTEAESRQRVVQARSLWGAERTYRVRRDVRGSICDHKRERKVEDVRENRREGFRLLLRMRIDRNDSAKAGNESSAGK